MAPAAKRRKTAAQEKFRCFSCDTDRISSAFPDYNPSAECEHLINTCKNCLKKWVEVQVGAGNFVKKVESEIEESPEDASKAIKVDPTKEVARKESNVAVFGVKCPHPDCEGVMRNVNVEAAATKKVYARFEELERKFIGDSTSGWRWCLAPDCVAGQVHVSPVKPEDVRALPNKRPKHNKKKPSTHIFPQDEDVSDPRSGADVCTCWSCGAEACVTCDRPYHEGETCAAFQARTKDRIEEEDKALKAIQRVTKACPSCKKRIEKNGGEPPSSSL